MQIVVSNNNLLRLTQVFEPQNAALLEYFRAKDPAAHFKRAMINTSWDGYKYFYNERAQTIRKAFLKELIDLCEEQDIPYEILDEREKSRFPVPAAGSFDDKLIEGIKAHPWQMRCWESACRGDIFHEIGHYFDIDDSSSPFRSHIGSIISADDANILDLHCTYVKADGTCAYSEFIAENYGKMFYPDKREQLEYEFPEVYNVLLKYVPSPSDYVPFQ